MDSNMLKLAIYESIRNNDIDSDTGYRMLDAFDEGEPYTEKFSAFSKGPVENKLKKLREIKNAKPGSYTGPKEVKTFIDKYYDDIVKCAKISEKEPQNIRLNDISVVVRLAIAFFGGRIIGALISFSGAGIVTAGAASLSEVGIVAGSLVAGTGLIAIIFATVVPIILGAVYLVIRHARKSNNLAAIAELSKISDALKKAKDNDIPSEYKEKISKAIDAISDAEVEVTKRTRTVGESVTDMKLKIYEACLNGSITEFERDELLFKLG